ncbi:MAG: restriction endonuclease [Proteobacteria bacterium ST_bin11]|nr:MAG: restriction endonuclease [Proteobacteria bacterium ST_bin11]
MAIPDYQSCMLPLLNFADDRKDHSLREAVEYLANQFKLTAAERTELLPSGQQATFHNRVSWARSYLKKAGLLDSPKRGVLRITALGLEVLTKPPERIDVKFLEQFPEFVEFRNATRGSNDASSLSDAETQEKTPEEILEIAHQNIRKELAQEILSKILTCSPLFFENLVVELLVKMGYGGSRKDAGERIGQSGDGGIDGIIKEDRLGLDAIYIQAKRWQGSVGRPEIQKFVGALQGQRAKKGVFITTSSFTQDALSYVSNIDTKVVLIDGQLLSSLMIDFDVGVSVSASYIVKKIDSDYFDEN